MIKMSSGLQVKYMSFLSDFNETWIFSSFSKNIQISNFMKIRPVGAELFHAGGRADTNLTVAFRNFAKALKNIMGLASCNNGFSGTQ
jgi:hypothetical protein